MINCTTKLMLVILAFININIAKSQEIEETALAYFADSILYKDDLFPADTNSGLDPFMLLPLDLNQTLVEGSLFKGISIYSEGIVRDISNPYFDRLDIISLHDDIPEERREVFIDFIKDFDRKKSLSFIPYALQLPDKLKYFSFEDFECEEEMLFLIVKSHLSSRNNYMVELIVYDRRQDNHYEFYVFLDQYKRVLEWQMK